MSNSSLSFGLQQNNEFGPGDNELPRDKQLLCKHLVHICNRCIYNRKAKIYWVPTGTSFTEVARNPRGEEEEDNYRVEEGIYNKQCFYCVLEGEELIDPYTYDPAFTYANAIKHSHCAYLIGRRDGYGKKILPEMKCKIKKLEDVYMDGYEAGKTTRELEECKARFCILLPDFLAKEN